MSHSYPPPALSLLPFTHMLENLLQGFPSFSPVFTTHAYQVCLWSTCNRATGPTGRKPSLCYVCNVPAVPNCLHNMLTHLLGKTLACSRTDDECMCSTPNGPPTVLPSPASCHAPSHSLDNHCTACTAKNNSPEGTVQDPDVEFAPLLQQVSATRKLPSHAAGTLDRCFVSILGRQSVYACSCEGCDTKQCVRHDKVAWRWTIKKIGLCQHASHSSYFEGMSLHSPLHMTLKLKDLLEGNCPQRARGLMGEAILGDHVVGKMSAKCIANWNTRRASPVPSTQAELEEGINELEEQ